MPKLELEFVSDLERFRTDAKKAIERMRTAGVSENEIAEAQRLYDDHERSLEDLILKTAPTPKRQ